MRFVRDRRSPIEQAKSGLRIALAIVASVAAVALFGLAHWQIVSGQHRRVGWLLMIALSAIVALTVQSWRRWFFYVPAYLGLRLGLWLLLGWFSPEGFVLVGFPVLMFGMAALSFRFSKSAKLHAFDRAILLFTAACLLASMIELFASKPSAMALLFAALGDIALIASRFYPVRKSQQRAAHSSELFTLNR